jgi:hypothetical protein
MDEVQKRLRTDTKLTLIAVTVSHVCGPQCLSVDQLKFRDSDTAGMNTRVSLFTSSSFPHCSGSSSLRGLRHEDGAPWTCRHGKESYHLAQWSLQP